MFLNRLVEMGGFQLSHHWHGINMLLVLECCLLAALICLVCAAWPRATRRRRWIALAAALSFSTAAWAASTKLSDLSASAAVAGTDLYYTVQTPGSGGVKSTAAKIATYVFSLFSQDCTANSTGTITCTKTNNVAFAASATTDATNATNIGSGTLPAGRLPALTGDVTTSAGSAATTLAAGSASNLNSGTLPAGRLPALTGDVTSAGGSAATTLAAGSASNLNSGTLPAGRLPALTGDVTSSAGSAATTLAAGSASNLNSGTLPAGRLPAFTGGCYSAAGSATLNCAGPQPAYVAASWYLPGGTRSFATGGAPGTNKIACVWGYIPTQLTISDIGGHATTAGSSNSQFAIYDASATGGYPGNKLSSTGNIANTAAGAVTGVLGANVSVGPGTANGSNLWFCSNQNDGTVVYSGPSSTNDTTFAFAVGSTTANGFWNSTTASTAAVAMHCTGAACTGGSSTFNTWPASLSGSTWTLQTASSGVSAAIVQFKVTSVP